MHAVIAEGDTLRAARNTLSKQIGTLMREGRRDEAEAIKAEVASGKDRIAAIDVELGVTEADRGVAIRSGYGAFNTFRQSARWAPREIAGNAASEETFGAVQIMRTDGFGENRGGYSASALLQHRFGTGRVRYRALAILHTARANLAGVVRRDDVADGTVCFTCVYPFATARAQNALAQRFLAGLFADFGGDDGSNGQLGAWVGRDNFRVQQNFTGFIESSQILERVAGRGDLINQRNRTTSLGLTGRYRTRPLRPVSPREVVRLR